MEDDEAGIDGSENWENSNKITPFWSIKKYVVRGAEFEFSLVFELNCILEVDRGTSGGNFFGNEIVFFPCFQSKSPTKNTSKGSY